MTARIAQRERERSVFSFLTTRSAWLPPVFGGGGLRPATDVLGKRDELHGRNVRLAAVRVRHLVAAGIPAGRARRAAVSGRAVYGAGMAEQRGDGRIFPGVRRGHRLDPRAEFFQSAVSWLDGAVRAGGDMLFYLLLPLLGMTSHKVPVTFWQALEANLAARWEVVKIFFIQPEVRKTSGCCSSHFAAAGPRDGHPLAVVISATTAEIGLALASFMFHVVHAFLFCSSASGSPLIRRSARADLGFGLPFLTLLLSGRVERRLFQRLFPARVRQGAGATSRDRSRNRSAGCGRIHRIPEPVVLAGVWLFVAVWRGRAGLQKRARKSAPSTTTRSKNSLRLRKQTCRATGGIAVERRSATHAAAAGGAGAGRAGKGIFAGWTRSRCSVPAYHRFLARNIPRRNGRTPSTPPRPPTASARCT